MDVFGRLDVDQDPTGHQVGIRPADGERTCKDRSDGDRCLHRAQRGLARSGHGLDVGSSPVGHLVQQVGRRRRSDELLEPVVDFVEGGQGANEGESTSMVGCWAIGATTDPTQGGTLEDAQASLDEVVGNDAACRPCDAALVLDPADVARAYWERAASPPPPTPLEIAPGKALTGLRAYLVIGGDNPYVETHDTPLGTLTFRMEPRYVIDWGDGATDNTRSQGLPYPGGAGEITHTYTEVGSVTVTVTAYWSTSWELAGEGDNLPELPVPTEASLDLPVEQRQAVID